MVHRARDWRNHPGNGVNGEVCWLGVRDWGEKRNLGKRWKKRSKRGSFDILPKIVITFGLVLYMSKYYH